MWRWQTEAYAAVAGAQIQVVSSVGPSRGNVVEPQGGNAAEPQVGNAAEP